MIPKLTNNNNFMCSTCFLLLQILQIGGAFLSICLTVKIYLSSYAWILLIYYYWIFVLDNETPYQEAKPRKCLINSKFARYVRNYYPVRLMKSEEYELNPNKNYLFITAPHGVLGIQSFLVFGEIFQTTKEAFPHHKSQSGLSMFYYKLPLLRELFLAFGVGNSSKDAIINVLTKRGGGYIQALTPGGAEESLLSCPNTYKTLIRKHKDFVEIALKTGAPLVPVVSFNIVDDFDYQTPNRILRFIQKIFLKTIKIVPPFAHGRCGLSFFPKRVPITFVGKICILLFLLDI